MAGPSVVDVINHPLSDQLAEVIAYTGPFAEALRDVFRDWRLMRAYLMKLHDCDGDTRSETQAMTLRVCKCGAPKSVHTAPVRWRSSNGKERRPDKAEGDGSSPSASTNTGCTWCSCDEYEEDDIRYANPADEWMSIIPERGYFR